MTVAGTAGAAIAAHAAVSAIKSTMLKKQDLKPLDHSADDKNKENV